MRVTETPILFSNENGPRAPSNATEDAIFRLMPQGLWLDAALGIQAPGGAFGAWSDRVRSLRYINNFSAPTVVTAGSSKAVRMAGVSTLKPEGGVKVLPASGSYSTVIVARVPAPGSGGGALISGRAPSGATQPPVLQASRYDATVFDVSSGGSGINGLSGTPAMNDNTWRVLTVSIKAGASGRCVIRLNGADRADLGGAIGTLNATSRELLIGGALGPNLGGANGFEQLFNGDLGLIMVFPDVVFHENTAARDLVETYAMSKRALLI